MLKGCDEPYFSVYEIRPFVKLMKDHIPGLRDTADLVIVSGRQDVRDEQKLRIATSWRTLFCIGCLKNNNMVYQSDAKPRFRIIHVINGCVVSKGHIVSRPS